MTHGIGHGVKTGNSIVDGLNKLDNLRESRNTNKAANERAKNMLKAQQVIGEGLKDALKPNKHDGNRPRTNFIPKPLNMNNTMGSNLGLNPTSLALNGHMPELGGPSGANIAHSVGTQQAAVNDGQAVAQTSMDQMAQIMKATQESRTQMALMQLVDEMNNALSKQLKKLGQSISQLAG